MKLKVMFLLLAPVSLFARQGTPPLSAARPLQPLATIPQLVLPPTDVGQELAADQQAPRPGPLRFAVPHQVQITPANYGAWEQLSDGRVWRLRIASAGATNLNLGFTRFWLPPGATLHLISENENYFQGPYTAEDNKPHGQLWTPVIPGEKMVIELFVPATATPEPQLVLGQVGAGYRDLFNHQAQFRQPLPEGTCNMDVVCPYASAWSNEIRSVGLYSLNGAFTCSGTLVADTAGDLRSYFLTANHCGIDATNAQSIVVYWNYQSTTCGTHGPGSLAQNQSGAMFRAAKTDVDFALIELDSLPDPSFNVFYSGWDRSGSTPGGGVGIHHPDADVKAISFSSNALTTVDSCIGNGSSTHWQVIWTIGVTEPGSSGSGLWNIANHLLVGTLSGGGSACSTPNSPDCYGKFALSWNSGTARSDRLIDWLDPINSGASSQAGIDPARTTFLVAAGTSLTAESCSPANNAVDPGETVTINFALSNVGGLNTTNLTANLLAINGVASPSAQQNYGVVLGQGAPVSRPFSFTANGACGGIIHPTLQLQDGARNLGLATFSLILGVPTTNSAVVFAQNFDQVSAPALPAGWTAAVTSVGGSGPAWVTSTSLADTSPNAAFAADQAFISDNQLTSPSIAIGSASSVLTFRHNYNLEYDTTSGIGYDGGVLEISIAGASFSDILDAGGSFVSNGYIRIISTDFESPLVGRLAWSGNSGGYITTSVNLPPSAAGQNVRFRWRLGCDDSNNAIGWYVDTISLSQIAYACCTSTSTPLPTIVSPRLIGSTNFAFSFDTQSGKSYVVQSATILTNNVNATNWTSIKTNAGDGTRQSYTNSTSGSARRFFRLRVQ